jgi:hypothetical protein
VTGCAGGSPGLQVPPVAHICPPQRKPGSWAGSPRPSQDIYSDSQAGFTGVGAGTSKSGLEPAGMPSGSGVEISAGLLSWMGLAWQRSVGVPEPPAARQLGRCQSAPPAGLHGFHPAHSAPSRHGPCVRTDRVGEWRSKVSGPPRRWLATFSPPRPCCGHACIVQHAHGLRRIGLLRAKRRPSLVSACRQRFWPSRTAKACTRPPSPAWVTSGPGRDPGADFGAHGPTRWQAAAAAGTGSTTTCRSLKPPSLLEQRCGLRSALRPGISACQVGRPKLGAVVRPAQVAVAVAGRRRDGMGVGFSDKAG